MKSLFVHFGTWLLCPVVDQLVEERLEKEEKAWLDALKPFLDVMRAPMGLADKKTSGGQAT